MESDMYKIIKTGRAFYGISFIAYGINQIVVGDFRPVIIPEFPSWLHQTLLSYLIGAGFVIAGLVVSGIVRTGENTVTKTFFWLGTSLLFIIITCHLPFRLFISPNKAIHLGVWIDTLKELAFAGGAFIMSSNPVSDLSTGMARQYGMPDRYTLAVGRIFFCTTMILFGYSHFLYTDFVAELVPQWLGGRVFWTYAGGVGLIAFGACIILNLFRRYAAYLLAAMIFLWVPLLHVPRAIANPGLQHGNEIVSAFDALLFSGVALVIACSKQNFLNGQNSDRNEQR
jgi:uncharacterized membrane protein YphA (DoxX/SURF4 family)